MFTFYILFSYMFMLGSLLSEAKTIDNLKMFHIWIFLLSPFTFPMIIGMNYNKKN